MVSFLRFDVNIGGEGADAGEGVTFIGELIGEVFTAGATVFISEESEGGVLFIGELGGVLFKAGAPSSILIEEDDKFNSSGMDL